MRGVIPSHPLRSVQNLQGREGNHREDLVVSLNKEERLLNYASKLLLEYSFLSLSLSIPITIHEDPSVACGSLVVEPKLYGSAAQTPEAIAVARAGGHYE